ncbi:pyridoxal phosphate-dependent aminotransferase [Halorutilales archaeon Cl-col2-1]
MSKFSERVGRVEPSATLRISDLASSLESEGADVVDLSVGEPDFTTPEHIREEAKEALDRGETGYTPTKGIPDLREAIAHKLREENSLSVDRDEIYVTPGAKDALFESIFSLLSEGDEAVLLDPAWVSYEAIVKMAGGEINRVQLDPETGFTPGSVDLAEHVSDDTRLMIVNTPSNPSGAVFSKDELKEIRDLAVDHDFWVVSDEIYEKIIYDAEHHSLGAMDGMANRTITVNGFSKAYAMTGWRLGYFTAPEELLDEAGKVHSHSVSCATNFAQWGGLAALDGSNEPVEKMRDTFESRRDLLMDALADIGVEMPEPKGAFYAFVPVETDDDAALAEEILQEEHVATTPGSAFGVDGYLRMSYAASEERIKEGVERIADYV